MRRCIEACAARFDARLPLAQENTLVEAFIRRLQMALKGDAQPSVFKDYGYTLSCKQLVRVRDENRREKGCH